jgi:hypothetical protein
MSDTTQTEVLAGRTAAGRFAKGNELSGGAVAINRLAKKLRLRLIKRAAKGGDVDRLYRQLLKDAEDPENPGIVRVAAAKVLLGYILGKPDQQVSVEHPAAGAPVDLDKGVALLLKLGAPVEHWPLMYREHHRKKVEARVSVPEVT